MSGRRKSLAGRLRDHLERPEISAVALAGYRHERIRDLCFPVASALMEGGFVGVLADKIYHVHPSVLALISAAPMLGNLSSFLWVRLAHGRPKVPILVRLQLFFMTFVALVAFLPPGPVGATVLTVSLVMARLVLGGIVTLRSLVWTLNSPRDTRARVTARLHFFAIGTLTVTSFLGSAFLGFLFAGSARFLAHLGWGRLARFLGGLVATGGSLRSGRGLGLAALGRRSFPFPWFFARGTKACR